MAVRESPEPFLLFELEVAELFFINKRIGRFFNFPYQIGKAT
jgi:hypothetical protein